MGLLGRMVLFENGFVVLRNENDETLGFKSMAEFKKYYPEVVVPNMFYVDYEPDRTIPLHVYRLKADTVADAPRPGPTPFAPYEAILADFDLIKTRKVDEYYGLTPEEAAALDAKKAKDAEFQASLTAADEKLINSPLMSMTYAELDTWFDENVTSLAQAKNALKLMGAVVMALAKRVYRE